MARLATGRPLLLGGDAIASLGAAFGAPAPTMSMALASYPAIGRLVREQPAIVSEHYHREIAAGVDVVTALTADTCAPRLAEIGMAFRAAALTSAAIDLALDAAELAPRPLAVAGVLAAPFVTPPTPASLERVGEEYALHAARLAAGGCDVVIVRSAATGWGRRAQRVGVSSAATTSLPTWAVLRADAPDESLEDGARAAVDAGASALLLEVTCPEEAAELARQLHGIGAVHGVLAGDPVGDPEAWASAMRALVDTDTATRTLIVGGGPGTTARHIAALSSLLHARAPSIRPRAAS